MTTATDYEVRDGGGTSVATGTYVAGGAIDIGGRRIVLDGTPAAGDRFDVRPAGSASVFDIVDDLATALETPRSSPAEGAQLLQSTGAALQDLDQALGRVLDLRTTVGARLSTIDDQTAAGDGQKVRLQSELSGVEDLDYAEAISRFQLQQTALEAAQQTYVQVGRSSLFDFIR
jgi:flagellar hook-associated protein 3 FlgL